VSDRETVCPDGGVLRHQYIDKKEVDGKPVVITAARAKRP